MFLVRLSSLFFPVLSCNLTYILHQIEITSRTRLFLEVNKIESINSSKVFTQVINHDIALAWLLPLNRPKVNKM